MKEFQIITTITVKENGEIIAESEQAAGVPDNNSEAAAGVYSSEHVEKTEAETERYHQGNGLWIDGYSKNDEPNGHIKDYSVSSCWMTRKYYLEKYAPYQPGDTLYVRETWNTNPLHDYGNESNEYVYKADYDGHAGEFGWRPSIHMPKEVARIFLKVMDVRVERLQDMDKMDAVKEGIDPRCCVNLAHALTKFKKLWDSTIKKSDHDLYSWEANPWVWVIEFERIVPDGF